MNIVKRWILGTLTTDDMLQYFYEIGIGIDLTFERKRKPRYYAKNSRLYRVKK